MSPLPRGYRCDGLSYICRARRGEVLALTLDDIKDDGLLINRSKGSKADYAADPSALLGGRQGKVAVGVRGLSGQDRARSDTGIAVRFRMAQVDGKGGKHGWRKVFVSRYQGQGIVGYA